MFTSVWLTDQQQYGDDQVGGDGGHHHPEPVLGQLGAGEFLRQQQGAHGQQISRHAADPVTPGEQRPQPVLRMGTQHGAQHLQNGQHWRHGGSGAPQPDSIAGKQGTAQATSRGEAIDTSGVPCQLQKIGTPIPNQIPDKTMGKYRN